MKQINYEFYGAGSFYVNSDGKKNLVDRKEIITNLKYEINPLLEKKIIGIRKLNYNGFTEFVFIIPSETPSKTPPKEYKILVDNTKKFVLLELNTLVEAIKQSNYRIKKRGAKKSTKFKVKVAAIATIAAVAVGGFVLVKNNEQLNKDITAKIISLFEKDRLADDDDVLAEQLYYQNSMDQNDTSKSR